MSGPLPARQAVAKRVPLGGRWGPSGLPCADFWELTMRPKFMLRSEASPNHLLAALGGGDVDFDMYFTMLSRCRPNLLKSLLESQK